MSEWIRKINWKYVIVMLIGNVILGLGIAIFKLSGLGNDPFSGMVMALAECVGIEYARFIGVIITSLGISMYQLPKQGVAPYDSISLIMTEKWPKIPYFWCRVSNDAISALVCWLAGGIVGLGTLVSAFGFGPFVQFFDTHFTSKVLAKLEK